MKETDKTYITWSIDGNIAPDKNLKPMLNPKEQVALLKTNGITFKDYDEQTAIEILAHKNTFLHIAAFRKMFQKYESGDKIGCYVNLDFSDLLYLNEVDEKLRQSFQVLAGHVESTAKTQLIAKISDNENENGYNIVADFMKAQSKAYRESIERNLKTRAASSERADVYVGSLIEHYRSAMPVWVLLEVVPFGTLLAFMLFCAKRWNDKELQVLHYALTDVKAVRNCCSHGSCIINGFADKQKTPFSTSSLVFSWLAVHGVKNSPTRRAKLANRRMQQLVTTLAISNLSDRFEREISCAHLETLTTSLRDCVKRYGVQNSFVSYLSFLADVIDRISWICKDGST